MTLEVVSSVLLGIFIVSSHAAAFVEGGVASSEPATRFEPQVALVCGSRNQYHAQHMSSDGRWVTDNKTKVTCLKEKVDILQYCKQVYPDRDITNIVEMSQFVKVSNFCRVGHSKCKTSIRVKPFRCLEGLFQSDALLVPEGCLFDHIHNQSRCWEFDQWNNTADQACQGRRLSLKAFAMLLPCGIDVFSGVEFVCCPKNYKAQGKTHTIKMEEPLALPQTEERPSMETHKTPSEDSSSRDEYFSRFDPHQEHEAFRRAEQRLEERHREKVSKIMKEWSELEERYQELHSKDPTGAEEFKLRMTQRFQSTVQSVEAENEAEKHQLTALHQQRIVAHINEMKREAMTCYTRAIDDEMPNTHKVQKCLQRLLRSLNKDRHHSVSHFKHLLNTDYEAADGERDSTLQHLSDLDRMVNQSINMLKRHPDLYAKIGRLMEEYARALKSKDSTPSELSPTTPRNNNALLNDDYDDSEEEDESDNANEIDSDDDEVDDDDDDDEDDEDDEDEADDESDEDDAKYDLPQASHLPTLEESHPETVSEKELPEVTKPEKEAPTSSNVEQSAEPVVAKQHEPIVSHSQHHEFAQHAPGFSVIKDAPRTESTKVYFTLAFAGVALMAAMVVGIVILRRRNIHNPHNQGFIEVDQAITPEERHVTNMQVNGYENPTYKYFEEK